MTDVHDCKAGVNLLSLPPEILIMILGYSLEANLIHACHRLRDALPPFVQWTKSLAGIAVCLSDPTRPPFSQYGEYANMLGHYEAECGLTTLTPRRRRDIREAVFLSTWFKSSHFRKILLELSHAMPNDSRAFYEARNQSDPRSRAPLPPRVRLYGVRGPVDVFRLDQFCVAISTDRLAPLMQSVKIWLTDDDRLQPTAINDLPIPDIRNSNTAEGMVLGFIWATDFQQCYPSNVEAMQNGLVHCILTKYTHGVTWHVRRTFRDSYQSGPFGSVEWKHVVLAAKHSNAEIMKLLLDRHAWPVWEAVRVRQLADDVKSGKSEEWESKYQILMYECSVIGRCTGQVAPGLVRGGAYISTSVDP